MHYSGLQRLVNIDNEMERVFGVDLDGDGKVGAHLRQQPKSSSGYQFPPCVDTSRRGGVAYRSEPARAWSASWSRGRAVRPTSSLAAQRLIVGQHPNRPKPCGNPPPGERPHSVIHHETNLYSIRTRWEMHARGARCESSVRGVF
jgi:hypothetical protein